MAKLKVGEFAKWNSSGGTAQGKVLEIKKEGSINVPNSEFIIEAEENDPAVLLQIWNGEELEETKVGHKMSTLTKIKNPTNDHTTQVEPLVIDNTILGRVGIQKYNIDGEEANVLRPEEEVRKSVGTFLDVPVTVNHPEEKEVTNDNKEEVTKGKVITSDYSNGFHRGTLKIDDPIAQEKAKTTHQMISNGYRSKLVKQSGTWVDELGVHGHIGQEYKYDYIQTDIKGNHVALVERGRAGAIASIHLDSIDQTTEDSLICDSVEYFNLVNDSPEVTNREMDQPSQTKERKVLSNDKPMPKQIILNDEVINVDGENPQQIVDAFNTLKNDLKSTNDSLAEKENELATLNDEKEKITAERDVANQQLEKVQNDKAELEKQLEEAKQQTSDEQAIADGIASRMKLWDEVKDVLTDMSYSMDEKEIKKAFVKALYPDMELEDASKEYLDACYDMALRQNVDMMKKQHDSIEEDANRNTVTDAMKQSEKEGKKAPKITRDAPLPGDEQDEMSDNYFTKRRKKNRN